MSDTERRPYAQVMRVAECLVDALRPSCHRIEIAGSLRRQKEMCGDIEIVARPIAHTNLLGEPTDSTLVDDALSLWPLTFHKNGEKYKSFSFEWQPDWIFKVDLFLPTIDTWGVVYLLRTGSDLFSKRMVTARSYGGYKPEQYTVEKGRVRVAGMLLPTPEEEDVFQLFGVEWIEPRDRI